VKRSEMEATMEAAVFGARAGDVVGPFKTDAGWRLVRVEALHPAKLDETTGEEIKSWLFNEWLNEQRRKMPCRELA
jgi:peptidyl-prolyl cis-trans isomerase D